MWLRCGRDVVGLGRAGSGGAGFLLALPPGCLAGASRRDPV